MERAEFLSRIARFFRSHPIVGILGPRQCGKTTLARAHVATLGNETSAGDGHGAGARVHYFCPGDGDYPLTENVRVAGLRTLARE